MSKTGKRIGRPPKKGLPNSSLGAMASEASSSMLDTNKTNTPTSSPEPDEYAAKRRKTTLASKRYVTNFIFIKISHGDLNF